MELNTRCLRLRRGYYGKSVGGSPPDMLSDGDNGYHLARSRCRQPSPEAPVVTTNWVAEAIAQGSARAARLPALVSRRSRAAFVAVSLLAFAILLYSGRHSSFYGDEWYFIDMEGAGSLDDWLRPWNAHWSLVPLVLYRGVFSVVGLHSYLPYLAVLLAVHVVAAAGLFVLIRRTSGGLVALGAASLFLLLGTAYQNLFWAFQLGFVLSTALGLWALVAFQSVDRRSHILGALLVLASLASSGMGVAFAVAVAAQVISDRNRRRSAISLVPVCVIFLLWLVTWGRAGVAGQAEATGRLDIAAITDFVVRGPLSYVYALIGPQPVVAWALYACALAAGGVAVVRRELRPTTVGAGVGLATMLALIAIGRGEFGVDTTAQPRYVYEGVAFLLLVGSGLIGARVTPDSRTRVGDLLAAGLSCLALLALVHNVTMIPQGAKVFADNAGELRATVRLADRYGAKLRYQPPPAIGGIYVPTPEHLARVMPAFGRVDTDIFRASIVLPPTNEQLDRALWRLVGGVVQPQPILEPPRGLKPPSILRVSALSVDVDGSCLALRPRAAPPRLVVVTAVVGGGISVWADRSGPWSIGLGRDADPQDVNSLIATIPGASWHRIRLPELGDESSFLLTLRLPPDVEGAMVCST